MLSTSSHIQLPQPPGQESATRKRAAPHDAKSQKPSRSNAPFIIEEDDSDDDFQAEPSAKRRMLDHQPDAETPSLRRVDRQSPAIEQEQNAENAPPMPGPGLSAPPPWSATSTALATSILSGILPQRYEAKSCSGSSTTVKERKATAAVSYESIVAARSKTKEGRAKRSYYGIDIHELINNASTEIANTPIRPNITLPKTPAVSVEEAPACKNKKSLLWTEKYRAKKFMDLCGDDGTNRQVLRWLKKWDPVVFPGQTKFKPMARRPGQNRHVEEEKPHRKILMLTGAPGLGKTTLAHVCAKQAGYEVLEINASDDRSRDVVKNRIRTSLGTESVKTVTNSKNSDGSQKLAKPICVVVDEVDGVVAGSGASGEGGFVKALIDLVLTDQKNASAPDPNSAAGKQKKKGDDFRLMRPLVLICNDVYHPSLRPLRQSNLAEVIHVGRPSLDAVVGRIKAVFEKEGVPCDKDAARKICEAAWGMTSGIDAKKGAESTVEGDLRGVMVVGEWVAGRFKATTQGHGQRLSRQWVERHITADLASSAAGARGLGRGSVRDIVQRLFQEGGGFPKQKMNLSESKSKDEQPQAELGFGEHRKKYAMDRLRQMVDTSGEVSSIVTDILAEYPNREFNDDIYLTKPNLAYDWLHFHDTCQSRLYSSQEWELAPYLSLPVLACHHLFASPKRQYVEAVRHKPWENATEDDASPPLPFSGPRADFQAREAEKLNRSQLQALQSQLSPTLMRSFRGPEDVATDLLPYLMRLVSPDVKPVVVGGSQGTTASVRKESERNMVQRASHVLAEMGINLVKGKIESETAGHGAQFVYRMEP